MRDIVSLTLAVLSFFFFFYTRRIRFFEHLVRGGPTIFQQYKLSFARGMRAGLDFFFHLIFTATVCYVSMCNIIIVRVILLNVSPALVSPGHCARNVLDLLYCPRRVL